MELKLLGFYRELRHGDPEGPSLYSKNNSYDIDLKELILDYLSKGHTLVISLGPVRDIMDDSQGIVGTATIYTDGVWAWPGDLMHYVGCHESFVSEDFIQHATSHSWKVPQHVTISDLVLPAFGSRQ